MFDLEPATRTLSTLVQNVRDDQLGDPTPSEGRSLADLLDHVDGLSMAFTMAARKVTPPGGSQPPESSGDRLAEGWRTRIAEQLDGLAEAWRDPAAWGGMTEVGGVTMPGDACAAVAADELVVHGWDLAVSSGQAFRSDPRLVAGALAFVEPAVTANPGGIPGLFGPANPVADEAPPLDRLLNLTGRDPAWKVEGLV